MKPRVASENFISTFACKDNAVELFDKLTEIQHRGLDVVHAGEIPRVYGFVQIIQLILTAAFEEVMVCFI